MKKQKLSLEELKVESFITNLHAEKKAVKGANGTLLVPIALWATRALSYVLTQPEDPREETGANSEECIDTEQDCVTETMQICTL